MQEGNILFYFLSAWWRHQMETFSGWENNHEAGDLRRYVAHCDVNVMSKEPDTISLPVYAQQLCATCWRKED